MIHLAITRMFNSQDETEVIDVFVQEQTNMEGLPPAEYWDGMFSIPEEGHIVCQRFLVPIELPGANDEN